MFWVKVNIAVIYFFQRSEQPYQHLWDDTGGDFHFDRAVIECWLNFPSAEI